MNQVVKQMFTVDEVEGKVEFVGLGLRRLIAEIPSDLSEKGPIALLAPLWVPKRIDQV